MVHNMLASLSRIAAHSAPAGLKNHLYIVYNKFQIIVRSLGNKTPSKLDLGGVGRGNDGYKTVNLDPGVRPDYVGDVTNLNSIGIRNESLDEIYLSHTFEHIEIHRIADTLRHWRSKLRKGGILRIKGPNIEFYFELLNQKRITEEIFIHLVFGHYPRIDKQRLMQHKWAWTRDFLKRTLEESGFAGVTEYDAGGWQFDYEWFPEFNSVLVKDLGMLGHKP